MRGPRARPIAVGRAKMTMTNVIARSKDAAAHLLSCPPVSRRHVLAGGAAVSAASFMPAGRVHGKSAAPRVIDTHHHFYPPGYQKAWLDSEEGQQIPHFANQVGWTREKAVEQLDKNGVATGVLSIASTPGTWFGLDVAGAERMV